MRTILLFFALLFVNLTFSQATINQSFGFVQTSITNPIFQQPGEIFRFRAGSVRQLDAGPSFNFNNSRWFSLGSVNTGSQTVYGLRFQLPNKALTFGYQDISSINPRIQWIGSGSSLGDLEFRSATSFTSTASNLVATMKGNGNTIFGNPAVTGNNAKVSIENPGLTGLRIIQSSGGSSSAGFNVEQTLGAQFNSGGIISTISGDRVYGLYMKTAQGGQSSIGIQSFAYDSPNNNIGVRGTTFGTGNFEAGIYGETPNNNGNNFAGFFDGDVVTVAGSFLPSDKRLKDNITEETKILERLALLRPVNYDYKKMSELNLPSQKQHGFISQELAEVFPELTKDITKPVFDKEGKIISTFSMKGINYTGLISVLTAGVKELNDEVALLKQELADLKERSERNSNGLFEDNKRAILKQNVPNPFADQTSISYQLPQGSDRASLMVFNMNGNIIKEFPLTKSSGEITINASQIGKGLFIYSLVQGGQELISKKMVIK